MEGKSDSDSDPDWDSVGGTAGDDETIDGDLEEEEDVAMLLLLLSCVSLSPSASSGSSRSPSIVSLLIVELSVMIGWCSMMVRTTVNNDNGNGNDNDCGEYNVCEILLINTIIKKILRSFLFLCFSSSRKDREVRYGRYNTMHATICYCMR